MEEEIVTSEPVLFTWTDAESGEELCILVQGPPEFLAELRADGFLPVDREDPRPSLDGTTHCTVRVKVAG